MVVVLEQPFAHAPHTVAPDPTNLWGESIRKPPYPTNSGWLNFVLGDGTCAEYLHPYMIKSLNGGVSICYPCRGVTSAFIFQAFVPNLTVSCKEDSTSHRVTHYDDLSVTLEYGSHLSVPLVRGCPYVTFLFKGGTPVFSTAHAVLELRSNPEQTRHKLVLNNGQTWLIYSSSKLPLDKDLSLASHKGFKGVIRIALLPCGDDSEDFLDRHSKCYPVRGTADFTVPFRVKYVWKTLGWGELLMLSLPHHREILQDHKITLLPQFSYVSIDGSLEGVVGDHWHLQTDPLHVGWYSLHGLNSPEARDDIIRAAMKEVDRVCPARLTIRSTYFSGKALARAARVGLIAEELNCPAIVKRVCEFLTNNLTPWLDCSFEENGFLYDKKWGGIISRDGAADAGADFGLGVYNDHHFHFGYFCYAGAVLAKLDRNWAESWKGQLYALVRDYTTTDLRDDNFTRLRCFDPWVLHSWAGGITQFDDGRNQESTSEAVNAYYAAALLGLAYDDCDLLNLGLTLSSLEILASKALWHVKSDNVIYEPEFVNENKLVGVLWANKRDTNLWFASRDNREMCLGIQVLPLSPITEILFSDIDFVKELVGWALPSLSRPGVTDCWRGFVYALMALYNPVKAHRLIHELTEHDDGNSLTNLLCSDLFRCFPRQQLGRLLHRLQLLHRDVPGTDRAIPECQCRELLFESPEGSPGLELELGFDLTGSSFPFLSISMSYPGVFMIRVCLLICISSGLKQFEK
ncbi:hypothetical protein R1sor_007061 [Riccia sorocarpa]|uniref:glucan endo-1,3-beta-D-glucosidase n=1 Tax=Riccia sorocarpa TaxID=122646 RepID=A0ABD3HTK3_9MARC